MNKKPLILVINDDGITAPGIRVLISVMNEIGNVDIEKGRGLKSTDRYKITVGNDYHTKEAFGRKST